MKMLDKVILKEKLSSRAKSLIDEGRLAQSEVLVRQGGKTVFHGRFGVAREDALYRAASMTKPITAVALLQQVDAGRVRLDDPLAKYLPAYRHMTVGRAQADGSIVTDGEALTPIRVFHLLCHTSGIGTSPLYEHQRAPLISNAETADYYAAQPLAFDPYTAQAYSATIAFDVAARLVELLSGEGFADYLARHIFAPLAMTDTTFSPSAAQWARVVPMHDRAENGCATVFAMTEGCVFEDYPCAACAAGAGLLTSAADYDRFAQMLLRGGTAEDGCRVLSEDMVRRMRTPHVPESIMDGAERWGLGVRVITRTDYAHGLPVGTFGWSGAYGTHFFVDPENAVTAVLMKNSKFDGGAGCFTANSFEEDVTQSLV